MLLSSSNAGQAIDGTLTAAVRRFLQPDVERTKGRAYGMKVSEQLLQP